MRAAPLKLLQWNRFPTKWILRGGLKDFQWAPKRGGDQVAALMVLVVIGQHADNWTREADVTYTRFQNALGLSRTMVARGLDRLCELGIVSRITDRQSGYRLHEDDLSDGWGKLPSKGLYRNGQMPSFYRFSKKSAIELDALKLWFLALALRNNQSNAANVSYDKIVAYTGIRRERLKAAADCLVLRDLIRIERVVLANGNVEPTSYRLTHLDSYRHAATTSAVEY